MLKHDNDVRYTCEHKGTIIAKLNAVATFIRIEENFEYKVLFEQASKSKELSSEQVPLKWQNGQT